VVDILLILSGMSIDKLKGHPEFPQVAIVLWIKELPEYLYQ
jgi:hypothetical protein